MSKASLEEIRHSLAHLLGAAVLDLYPGSKLTLGPAIDDGFYYDIDVTGKISEEDLPKIEDKMRELLKEWKNFEGKELTKEEALEKFAGNQYKEELVREISEKGEKITIYKSGDFEDLCRGGHVSNIKDIDPKAFKLRGVAGAYWRGDEKNAMLTRIYGYAFYSKKELDEYIVMLEEARKRDHKKIGPELDLFTFSSLVGSGLPLWTPRGTLLRDLLDNFVWELRRVKGYERVDIPHITKKDLYEKSGHWDKYKDDLFKIETREGHVYAMKPMNCPHHIQIYDRRLWSYRDLPQRYASTTKVYRDEQSGELAGLSRVLSITQDDAHVFCRFDQIEDEAKKIWEIIENFYGVFGFKLRIRLSLSDPSQPDKYLGDRETWEKAESILRGVAKSKSADPVERVGEAAFYGPKLDFIAKDSIGRDWQVATIQLDMNMPERFDLVCVNEKGERERIAMIHAAIMGSIERFLSVLIEHYAGVFPLWLSPVQVKILPVSDKHNEHAAQISASLKNNGLRVEVNNLNETLGKKIRAAELEKVPYLIILGDKEVASDKVAVRKRTEGDLGQLGLVEFIEQLQGEIKEKK